MLEMHRQLLEVEVAVEEHLLLLVRFGGGNPA
jgi:hypothetical protein